MKICTLILKYVLFIAGISAFAGFTYAAPKLDFTPPAVGPSDISFTNVSTSEMTLSWTNGDGKSRVVLMRGGSGVNSDPIDGMDYSLYQTVSPGVVVVYKGTGNSFVLKNTGFGPLASGTDYYFEIFEYNGTGASTEYLTTSTATGHQLAEISTSEPSSGATSLTVTNITGNSMDLSWTSGNGTARIVVARQGSAVDGIPTDGMGAALYQSIGNGNIVVYNGTGNSFTFKSIGAGSLTTNTAYYFAVFEYNGSETVTNYNTSQILTGSATTLSMAAEPTQPVSGATVTFRTDIPEQRMDISWAGGDGAGTLIIMRAGSAPDESVLPQDRVDYFQWTTIAPDHYICYKGSGNSVSIKSNGLGDLEPNTTYYFRVIEFNGSAELTNYLTSSTFSFSAITLSTTASGPPTNLIFAPQNGSSQTVSWTNGGGIGRLVIAKKGSAVDYTPYDLPVDGSTYPVGQHLGSGNYVIFNGGGNSFVFSSFASSALQLNTNYHFAVFEYTGTGNTINYLTENAGDVLIGNVTTPSLPEEPTTASNSLVFSNVSNSSMTLTWSNGEGARRIVVARKDAAVTSDPLDRTDYNVFQSLSSGQIVVYDGTGNSFVFNNDGSGPLVAGSVYHFEIFEYNGAFDLTNYLLSPTLVGSQVASAGIAEPTVAASNLSFTNVQTSQMTLNWANGDGTNRIVVYREGSPVTAVPTDGNSYTNFQSLSSGQIVVYNGTGSSFSFSNSGFGPLTPNTTYYFAIFEYNVSGSSSNYLGSPNLSGSQTTLSSPSLLAARSQGSALYSNDLENFEEGVLNEKFDIFPNPSKSTVNISTPGGEFQVGIYTTTGAQVYRNDSVQNTLQVDVSKLPQGIYYVIVQNQDLKLNKKLFVK